MRQLPIAFVACFALGVLPRCAAVHDATPASCPAGQQPSGALCVCVSTQVPPVDGNCKTVGDGGMACSVDDCEDDGNPCTEPTCVTDMSSCSNEPVAGLAPCIDGATTGSCMSGACIAEPAEWELGEAFPIGGEGGKIIRPRVAVDDTGNAVAVWSEGDALMVCQLDPSKGWGEPLQLEESFEADRGFHIDMDAAGNAIVVYTRVEQGSIDVRAVRYDRGADLWRTPEVLSRPGAVASGPVIAITAGGNAVATWWEAPDAVLLARTAPNRLTWDAPVVISPSDGLEKGGPALSLADAGGGAVIYTGYGPEGNADRVWVTSVDAEDSVGVPVEIHRGSAQIQSVVITAAEDGELMAVWQDSTDIWHARFSSGQWESAGLLETAGSAACCQEVGSAGSGTFFAVWIQSGALRARRFTSEDGWGVTATFRDLSSARRPSLAMMEPDEAIAVWHEKDFIIFRHYKPDTGWSGFEKISPQLQPEPPPDHRPNLAVGSDGTLVTIWADGTRVWAWADRR